DHKSSAGAIARRKNLPKIVSRIEAGRRDELQESGIVRLKLAQDVLPEWRDDRLIHLESRKDLGVRHDEVQQSLIDRSEDSRSREEQGCRDEWKRFHNRPKSHSTL